MLKLRPVAGVRLLAFKQTDAFLHAQNRHVYTCTNIEHGSIDQYIQVKSRQDNIM